MSFIVLKSEKRNDKWTELIVWFHFLIHHNILFVHFQFHLIHLLLECFINHILIRPHFYKPFVIKYDSVEMLWHSKQFKNNLFETNLDILQIRFSLISLKAIITCDIFRCFDSRTMYICSTEFNKNDVFWGGKCIVWNKIFQNTI